MSINDQEFIIKANPAERQARSERHILAANRKLSEEDRQRAQRRRRIEDIEMALNLGCKVEELTEKR